MRATRWFALAMAIGCCPALCGTARAQTEDPYAALRQYDSQARQPVHAIMMQIQAAGTDPAKLADIETKLDAVLRDPNATFAGKQEAARFLWQVGSARSVPVLRAMLRDPKLANIARYALERNADPSAAAALRSELSAAKGPELVGVINSLGDRRDVASVPALKRYAASSDPLVSDAATAALGKIGTPAALAALRSLPDVGNARRGVPPSKGRGVPSANRTAERRGGRSLQVYNAVLRAADQMASSGKATERAAALKAFEGLTGPGYPGVVRAGALEGLARHGAPRAGAVALGVAASADSLELQRVAAHIAGSLASPADTRRALAAWPKLPPAAQVALLTAWADRNEAAAAPVAMGALKSENAEVRRAAIHAAAAVGGPNAVPTLAALAASGDDANTANVARQALARMRGSGVEVALVQEARQAQPDTRVAVITIMADRPGAATRQALLAEAADTDPRIASAALKSLGEVGTLEQEPTLVRILTATANDSVRDAAQSAIVAVAQRSGDLNAAAGPLLSAQAESAGAGRAAALSALAEVGGDRALDALTKATAASDPTVRSAAISALADTWSDPRAMPTLLAIAKSDQDKSVRVQALRGYLRLAAADDRAPADERLEFVRQAMTVAERPEEKRQALSVLRDIRVPGAVELAARQLDDPALVNEAADAVLYLAAPQRRGFRRLPAVTGPATTAALDKVIGTVKDADIKSRAEKLRQG